MRDGEGLSRASANRARTVNMSGEAKAGPPYLLVAIDPDASAIHTSQSCVLHWMISDAYFDEKTGMLSSGFVSAAYARPNPAEASGHHRCGDCQHDPSSDLTERPFQIHIPTIRTACAIHAASLSQAARWTQTAFQPANLHKRLPSTITCRGQLHQELLDRCRSDTG